MGLDPNADADIEILNGDFADNSVWGFNVNWVWQPNVARFIWTGAGSRSVPQANIVNVPGNSYEISFTLSNRFFVTPNDFVFCRLGGAQSSGFRREQRHTFVLTPYDYPNITINFDGPTSNVGNQCDIDDITITPLGDHITEILGFAVNGPHKKEVWTPVAADHMQLVAAYRDKSSCILLLDDLP